MALREVVLEGAAVLEQVAEPVVTFDHALADLADDMLETMYAAQGRGLAAPQVAIGQRLFVMDATWKSGTPSPQTMVNPVILRWSGETAIGEEACLSIPGQTYRVPRPTWIGLMWQDIAGRAFQARLAGFDAICVCHEIDHLNGIMISQSGVLV